MDADEVAWRKLFSEGMDAEQCCSKLDKAG